MSRERNRARSVPVCLTFETLSDRLVLDASTTAVIAIDLEKPSETPVAAEIVIELPAEDVRIAIETDESEGAKEDHSPDNPVGAFASTTATPPSPESNFSMVGGGIRGPDYLTSVAQWVHQLHDQIRDFLNSLPNYGNSNGVGNGVYAGMPTVGDDGSGWEQFWHWANEMAGAKQEGDWEPRILRVQLPQILAPAPPTAPVGTISDSAPQYATHNNVGESEVELSFDEEELPAEPAYEEQPIEDRQLPSLFSSATADFWAGLTGEELSDAESDPSEETDKDLAAREGTGSPTETITAFYDDLIQQLVLDEIPSDWLAQTEQNATDAYMEELLDADGLGIDHHLMASFGLVSSVTFVGRHRRRRRKGSSNKRNDSQLPTEPITRDSGRSQDPQSAGTSRWIRLSTDLASAQSGRTECIVAEDC